MVLYPSNATEILDNLNKAHLLMTRPYNTQCIMRSGVKQMANVVLIRLLCSFSEVSPDSSHV